MIKGKIEQWLSDNYPNLLGSFGLANPRSKPLPDIIEQCFNDLHGWVSVEDRLPKINESVLVSLNSGRVGVARYHPHNNKYSEWSLYFGVGEFTHWRPMPLPPSENG